MQNDALTNKLLDIINQVQNSVVTHAPDAVNLVLQSVRVDAIQNFMLGIPGIFLLICVLVAFKRFSQTDLEDIGFPLFLVGFGCVIWIGITFFDIWNYVAIFNPKLALAHQIISKVMQ